VRAVCCWCSKILEQRGAWWLCPTQACADRQWAWAYRVGTGKRGGESVLYVPTPRQTEFHESTAKHTLFGGAAGPGKSHALRWEFYKRCAVYPGYEALLLRRTFPELNKTHIRRASREQGLIGAKLYTGEEKVIKFPNGSLLEFGHCDDEHAISRYLSTEYDAIGFDQWEGFEPAMSLELMTRARSSKPGIRAVSKGGANPGGVGSLFLLDFFIDHTPDFEKYPALKESYAADQWKFVPALLDDNPYRDAEYEDTLRNLSADRYEQLRHGNWRKFAGQFFSSWSEVQPNRAWHVSEQFIPARTEYFASMDWGYVSPGCVLWWACLPDGHYHIRQELKYKGLTAHELAAEIKRINAQLGIARLRYLVCDPSVKMQAGGSGESIEETLRRSGLPVRLGDNNRLSGWTRVQSLLRAPDGEPWLTVNPSCSYLRRTLPAAISDKHDPEDVDTTIDDHALDALRYGAMSRPAPTKLTEPVKPKGSLGRMMDELIVANARG
jgi:phage terminase large subunit